MCLIKRQPIITNFVSHGLENKVVKLQSFMITFETNEPIYIFLKDNYVEYNAFTYYSPYTQIPILNIQTNKGRQDN